jgi:hypothetical protein
MGRLQQTAHSFMLWEIIIIIIMMIIMNVEGLHGVLVA